MSGVPVFAGTRVPVQTLIDHLEGGESIKDFLKGFPTVKKEQVSAFRALQRVQALARRYDKGKGLASEELIRERRSK